MNARGANVASVRSLPFSSLDLTALEDVDAEANSLMVYIMKNVLSH